MEKSTKLKVLCLHGGRQTKDVFKEKTGSLRKSLSKITEMCFAQAPHIYKPAEMEDLVDEGAEQRVWWNYRNNRADLTYEGLEESVSAVEKFVAEEGPFDGILGFSQGATLAAIICALCQKKKFNAEFKFAILVAGFPSLDPEHEHFYDEPITIPSLHVIGDTDQVIVKDRSLKLREYFLHPETLSHSGGHYVPAAKDFRQKYIDFLQQFLPA